MRNKFLAAVLAAAIPMVAGAADVTVSAAASLTNAFKELAQSFEVAHPGNRVLLNFAASDPLVQQIAKGAPVDVFASADQEAMDKAENLKLLAPGTRRDFASNTVVLVVPLDSRITSLADLAGARRLTTGNPASVPIGRYSREALSKANLWQGLEPKFVFATSVRQSLDYVARGEVDAGFVYATDVLAQKDKVKAVATIPTATPVRYPIAVVANAPQPALARQFAGYVASGTGQAILAKHGFGKP
ncbi:molybdate ABC transporter substrate-binding protein [Pseudoduganella albidiflava]|uniref:Molybdate ABC transporter substrate-binding protein n=1 Tax=Pseudoduganella albidiflava TaxID=321983 RepID=A0A411X401_9BURK|nr:molybdate ABC transporter substrate-binding protein [Pseudoduganella albidiflava]QBI03746.1 molybdate ABC transporter substrate-binding protein [Pseudoduganella albidiflava]GGY61988.1 molybdate ABC transporter substrate-binding protein [Pseudoduganella albidiflava]